MAKNLAHMRQSYEQGSLNESEIASDPFLQFDQWFETAQQQESVEANAMTLATVSQGQPSTRIVLLKSYNSNGFCFYTNYDSRKGKELAENPLAALSFYWPVGQRQVRIEGKIEKMSADESDTYYQMRPRGSRIGAWASPQSEVIPHREALDVRVQEIEGRFEGQETFPRPSFLGRLPFGACVRGILAGQSQSTP